jgi:hypothetical protein
MSIELGNATPAELGAASAGVSGLAARQDHIHALASGQGAPVGSAFVVLEYHANLSNERLLTAGTGISITDNGANSTVVIAVSGLDHGSLTGLTDDDHTIYALLAGRSGGQTLVGGTAVADILKLQGTAGNGTATAEAVQILVGNNGATVAASVLNNGNTKLCQAAGGVNIGSPTGGYKGAGTLNSASNIYVNNTQVNVGAIGITIGDGVNVITTGVKAYIPVPYACTVTEWEVDGKESGSIVLDIWMDTYANYPPTVADTITGSDKPTLSLVQKNKSTALTGWTTALPLASCLAVNVDSVSTVTQITLLLKVTKG